MNCTTVNAPITSSVPRGSLNATAVVLGEVHLGKASEKEPPESQYEPFNSPQERQPRRANEKPQKSHPGIDELTINTLLRYHDAIIFS